LKTAVALKVQKANLENEKEKIAILASAQEAIVDSLCEKTRSAAAQVPGSRIVITGGVACNSHLREKLPEAHFPAPRHCTDNAAMVALLAGLYEKAGKLTPAPWTATAHSTGDF
jgi:N6-L-threonylcarbamoyladenine synthase